MMAILLFSAAIGFAVFTFIMAKRHLMISWVFNLVGALLVFDTGILFIGWAFRDLLVSQSPTLPSPPQVPWYFTLESLAFAAIWYAFAKAITALWRRYIKRPSPIC